MSDQTGFQLLSITVHSPINVFNLKRFKHISVEPNHKNYVLIKGLNTMKRLSRSSIFSQITVLSQRTVSQHLTRKSLCKKRLISCCTFLELTLTFTFFKKWFRFIHSVSASAHVQSNAI